MDPSVLASWGKEKLKIDHLLIQNHLPDSYFARDMRQELLAAVIQRTCLFLLFVPFVSVFIVFVRVLKRLAFWHGSQYKVHFMWS